MSDTAYSMAHAEAVKIVENCVESIFDQIREGHIDRESELDDAIHEECDRAVIYTRDQHILVWCLDDYEDVVEEGSGGSTWASCLAAQAYSNLRAKLDGWHDEFVDAIEEAQKKLEDDEE